MRNNLEIRTSLSTNPKNPAPKTWVETGYSYYQWLKTGKYLYKVIRAGSPGHLATTAFSMLAVPAAHFTGSTKLTWCAQKTTNLLPFLFNPLLGTIEFVAFYAADYIGSNIENYLKGYSLHLLKDRPKENNLQAKSIYLFKEKNGSMQNRVGSSNNTGYVRHKVLDDGNCGYTAFGITRQVAYDLIINNLTKREVVNLLKPVVQEQLLLTNFYKYLKSKKVLNEKVKHNEIIENMAAWADDLAIISAYIEYDIKEKKIDAGWAHPAILQVLAHIQHMTLRIWQLAESNTLIPHTQQQYAQYITSDTEQVRNLLFVNGNHFEQLEFVGVDPSMSSTLIYPLDSSWSQKNRWKYIVRDWRNYQSEDFLPGKEKGKPSLIKGLESAIHSDTIPATLAQEIMNIIVPNRGFEVTSPEGKALLRILHYEGVSQATFPTARLVHQGVTAASNRKLALAKGLGEVVKQENALLQAEETRHDDLLKRNDEIGQLSHNPENVYNNALNTASAHGLSGNTHETGMALSQSVDLYTLNPQGAGHPTIVTALSGGRRHRDEHAIEATANIMNAYTNENKVILSHSEQKVEHQQHRLDSAKTYHQSTVKQFSFFDKINRFFGKYALGKQASHENEFDVEGFSQTQTGRSAGEQPFTGTPNDIENMFNRHYDATLKILAAMGHSLSTSTGKNIFCQIFSYNLAQEITQIENGDAARQRQLSHEIRASMDDSTGRWFNDVAGKIFSLFHGTETDMFDKKPSFLKNIWNKTNQPFKELFSWLDKHHDKSDSNRTLLRGTLQGDGSAFIGIPGNRKLIQIKKPNKSKPKPEQKPCKDPVKYNFRKNDDNDDEATIVKSGEMSEEEDSYDVNPSSGGTSNTNEASLGSRDDLTNALYTLTLAGKAQAKLIGHSSFGFAGLIANIANEVGEYGFVHGILNAAVDEAINRGLDCVPWLGLTSTFIGLYVNNIDPPSQEKVDNIIRVCENLPASLKTKSLTELLFDMETCSLSKGITLDQGLRKLNDGMNKLRQGAKEFLNNAVETKPTPFFNQTPSAATRSTFFQAKSQKDKGINRKRKRGDDYENQLEERPSKIVKTQN